MGYYNWGEQVGNSFMSMFAQNQQKRLEEKRIGMEQQRLQQAQMQLDDQLKTNQLTREHSKWEHDQKVADRNWLMAPENAVMMDRTLDNQNNPTAIRPDMAQYYDPYQEIHNIPYLSWDSKNNDYSQNMWTGQKSLMDAMIESANTSATARANLWGTKQQHGLERARIASQNYANSIAASGQRNQNRMDNLTYYATANKLVNENYSKYFRTAYVDGNGNLRPHTYNGATQEDLDKMINSLAKELDVDYEIAAGLITNSLTNRAQEAARHGNGKSEDYIKFGNYRQAPSGQNAINTRTGRPLESKDVSRSISQTTDGTYNGQAVRYNSKTGKWEVV